MVGATILVVALSAQAVSQRAGDVELDRLLNLYLSYGLPVPPEGSEVVVFESRSISNGEVRFTHRLAFASRLDSGKTEYYFGSRKFVRDRMREKPFSTLEDLPKSIRFDIPSSFEPDPLNSPVMNEDIAIALAMQAHSLGKTELAHQLVVEHGGAGSWSILSPYSLPLSLYSPPLSPGPEKRIAYLALHAAMNDWADLGSDAREISTRVLRAIGSGYIDTSNFEEVLEGILMAREPLAVPRTRVHELLAELIEGDGAFYSLFSMTPNSAFDKIVSAGDEALPAIADYIGDVRLTRHRLYGRKGSRGYASVDFLAGRLATHIIQDPILGPFGFRPSRAAVHGYLAWKKTGDRNQFLRGLMLPEAPRPNELWPDTNSSSAAAKEMIANDPDEFERVYRELVTWHPHVTGGHGYTIWHSDLPDVTKRRLILMGARAPILHHAFDAIKILQEFDEPEFQRLLDLKVRAIPKGQISDDDLDAATELVRLVASHDGSRAWAALEQTVPTLRPATRAALLINVVHLAVNDTDPYLHRMLSLMNKYLDDIGVPTPEQFGEMGSYSILISSHPTLSVGDLVAVALRLHLYEHFTDEFVQIELHTPTTIRQARLVLDEEMRKRGFDR